MKQLILVLAVFSLMGCAGETARIQTNTNSTTVADRSEKLETVTAHTTENRPAPMPRTTDPAGPKSKWSQSGEPIDTAKLDEVVADAETHQKAKPGNADARKTLADAYFERAVALTQARQYASAIGDYRRAFKLDPSKTEAKDWIDQIVLIYESMNKEYPKEGEEPPPLPFKRGQV
ncbi:MAG: hypothetical protein WBD22_03480 [Pyrinomonadaceae bacterium]